MPWIGLAGLQPIGDSVMQIRASLQLGDKSGDCGRRQALQSDGLSAEVIFALAFVSNFGQAIAEPGMARHYAEATPRPVTQPYSNAPVGASQPQYGLVQTGVANVMSMNGMGMFGQQPVMMPVFQVIQLQGPGMAAAGSGEMMKPSSMAPAPFAPAAQEDAQSPSASAPAGIAMSPSYTQQIGTMCTINNVQVLTQHDAACLQAGGQVAGASN
jgi:hypothetical protein